MDSRIPHLAHSIRFGRIAPTLSVTNIERSLDFYVGILGFEKAFENGSPAGFVIVKKDDAELHLTRAPQHRGTTQNVAHLMVADAAALYAHLEANGVRIVKGIRDADFGLRCFVFADPDGNRIDVGERVMNNDT
ncbi:glyoxalase superfamily protein [Pandoraea sp. NPDC090278]|uniref:glyoxalase superfamily protein n=1 Tax=Pandoraea sp. NPDC090278 TaxID=3364391 RepID=UPI00383A88E3